MEENLLWKVFVICYAFLIVTLLWQALSSPRRTLAEIKQAKESIFRKRTKAEWIAVLKGQTGAPNKKLEAAEAAIIAAVLCFWGIIFWVGDAFRP